MTDLDKKHNVLSWEAVPTLHYTYHRAKYAEHLFEIGQHHASGTFYLHILEKGRVQFLKSSTPTTLENAKTQAELFILNLKR